MDGSNHVSTRTQYYSNSGTGLLTLLSCFTLVFHCYRLCVVCARHAKPPSHVQSTQEAFGLYHQPTRKKSTLQLFASRVGFLDRMPGLIKACRTQTCTLTASVGSRNIIIVIKKNSGSCTAFSCPTVSCVLPWSQYLAWY